MEIDAFVQCCTLPGGNFAAPEARLITLLDCMQDVAGRHADSLGAGQTLQLVIRKALRLHPARFGVHDA